MNWYVKVKLTDHGLDVWKKDRDELAEWSKGAVKSKPKEYFASMADADGNHRFQLWELMQLFGPHIGVCKPMPFSTVLIMETKP